MKLNAQQQNALNSGISLEDVLAMVPSTEEEEEVEETSAQDNTGEEGEEQPSADTALQEATAKIAEMEANATALTQELDGMKAKLAEQEVAAQTAQKMLASMSASLVSYTTKMAVALGRQIDMKDKSPSEIVAQHDTLRAEFTTKFRPGRQSKETASVKASESDNFQASILEAAAKFKL